MSSGQCKQFQQQSQCVYGVHIMRVVYSSKRLLMQALVADCFYRVTIPYRKANAQGIFNAVVYLNKQTSVGTASSRKFTFSGVTILHCQQGFQ